MNFSNIACKVASLVFTLGIAFSGYSQSFLTNGLVAYYPFNGNVNDFSGHGNDGVIHGTDWKYSFDRFGYVNSLYLNTTSTPTYVTASRSQQLDFNQDFSLSVWAYLKSGTPPSTAQNLISNGHDSMFANLRLLSGYDAGTQDALEFVWNTSPDILNVAAWFAPVRDTWWQATVVRSGTNVSLYRNGSFLASAVMTPVSNSPTIWFGKHALYTYLLYGGIDDVRMYNRALSFAEVQQLYATESKGVPHPATATATVVNGFVVAIDMTGLGFGYTNAPLVEIRGGGGSGATATATISNGCVTGITITDAGIGYTSTPKVMIASPPFMPWLGIAVSKVKVTQHLVLGRNYVFESSNDLSQWNQIGPPFTAQEEEITQEFDVDVTGRFFRIREVP